MCDEPAPLGLATGAHLDLLARFIGRNAVPALGGLAVAAGTLWLLHNIVMVAVAAGGILGTSVTASLLLGRYLHRHHTVLYWRPRANVPGPALPLAMQKSLGQSQPLAIENKPPSLDALNVIVGEVLERR
jgi:hypothetical protein